MKHSISLLFTIALLFALLAICQILPCISASTPLKEALFYESIGSKTVQCRLCPRFCTIVAGMRGFCGTRENQDGVLYTLSFAKAVSTNIDPIEKKPLFHFMPSTKAFSVATAGCNLRCKFCQNWQISQVKPEDVEYTYVEPQDLVKQAKDAGCFVIAYTYTEPTVFYEYMLETAKIARAQGIKNIMHSNGFINEKPLRQLAKYLDAANIDLKGFNNDYYVKMAEGSLEPVLKSLKILKEEGVHIEITNLILPGYNDDKDSIRRMCTWIKENLGPDVPLHFSRFFPTYKMLNLNSTSVEVLEQARLIARESGLKYVYIGNVPGNSAENTYCSKCEKILIERRGYFVVQNNIENGKCKFCGTEVKGVW